MAAQYVNDDTSKIFSVACRTSRERIHVVFAKGRRKWMSNELGNRAFPREVGTCRAREKIEGEEVRCGKLNPFPMPDACTAGERERVKGTWSALRIGLLRREPPDCAEDEAA